MATKLRDYLAVNRSNVTAGLLFCVKGQADNEIYVLETDETNPTLPISLMVTNVKIDGVFPSEKFFNTNSSTPITTASYLQVINSTSTKTRGVQIYDTSGQAFVIAYGAPSSEIDQFFVPQGGNGFINLEIPAGTRVSVKSVTSSANSGFFIFNTFV